MKLLFENWRRFINEMSFDKDTKTVVGFDFDHTLARTAGGQAAYFDPQRKWRLQKYPDDIHPKYFETHEKVSRANARPAPLSDGDISKILATSREDPEQGRKLVMSHMHCGGSDPDPFFVGTQAQLDFYAQRGNWKPLWAESPAGAPNCWAFDFSSREKLEWEDGTAENSQQVPIIKAFKEAVAAPNVEVIVLTSRVSKVESQIADFLATVKAPMVPQAHIKGVGGKSKGQYLYDDVLSNEKDFDIENLYFYDDSEANITTISAAVKKAIENDLIEGEGVVYRVSKHDGAYEEAFRMKNPRTKAAEKPDE